MILPYEYIPKIINDARQKAFIMNRECMVKGCNNKSINSHTLWKKGILDILADNSKKVIALNVLRPIWTIKLEFKLFSINQVLTFKGFCQKHDHLVFKPIELDSVDYFNYDNQILISVRGLYHERRKKEINIDWFQEIIKQNILTNEEQILYLKNQIEMQQLGIKDISFFTNELNKEYHYPTGRYYFKTYLLPFIPVAASSIFNIDSYQTMSYNANTNPNWENEPLNNLIFNFFPVDDKSYLIIGFQSYFMENMNIINRINNYCTRQKLNLVSNIFIDRIESWVCNPSFYNKYLKSDSDYITSEFEKILENDSDFTGVITNNYNMFGRYLDDLVEDHNY